MIRDINTGRARLRRQILNLITYLVLITVAFCNLFPYIWTVLSSLKDASEILVHPLGFPTIWKFSNFSTAWVGAKMFSYFMNTVIVVAFKVVIVLLITSMAAYVLSRILHKTVLLYAFFALGIMIPVQALIVPLFIVTNKLHIANSLTGLVLVYVAVDISLSVFVLYGFMKTLPRDLEDSASIDGCSRPGTFFRIILPVTKPVLATVGILVLLNGWNEFLIPLVLVNDSAKKVISQGIQHLKGQYITDYGLVSAGLIIASIPVIVIYVIFQEQVIKGMTAGAVKG